jgi:predicted RNA-binding Zn ribbon-like protein
MNYLQICVLTVIQLTTCLLPFKCYFDGIRETHENFSPFSFIAGAPCLDFVNTVGPRVCEQPRDKLRVLADLVRWSKEAGLIQEGEAVKLPGDSEANSSSTTKVLEEAKELREALFRIFGALGRKETPAAGDLATLNKLLRAFPVRLEVCAQGKDFRCERKSVRTGHDQLLAPIAWSAADLLVSEQVHHVRQCADAECGWLFVDTTKNHSRRWCAMSDCGSHAKAKRYYQRKKKMRQ